MHGQYEYKYTDLDGSRRSIYSWRLVSTDRLPAGKRDGLSLREKEAELSENLNRGICIKKAQITLEECIHNYLEIKPFANATYENYKYYYKKDIVGSWLGKMKVIDIKKSHIKKFYLELAKKGYSNGTILIFQKIIHPALGMLVEDEILGSNPSDACCRDYVKTESRNAMSREERQIFFDEILKLERNGDDYYLIFTVFKGLACRINELIGLTWEDIDMKNRYVSINHGIVYRKKDGKIRFYATKGTDKNRERIVYMTDDVYKCFTELRKKCFRNPSTVEVDGYKNFVFVSKSGSPLYPATLNKALYRMVAKYQRENDVSFPKISNHIFRHTGCTEMAEAEVEPGALQYIMGHKDYKQIRKVYDSVSLERVRQQMEKLNHKSDSKFTTDLRQKAK